MVSWYKYCESFNNLKDKCLTQCSNCEKVIDNDFYPNKPKVNPKDNTITIKPIKDSWNREEVVGLLKRIPTMFKDGQLLNIWIDNNL